MKKIMLGLVGIVALAALGIAYLLFWQARPEDTTAASVYSGDGRAFNYCEKPMLAGPGLRATEIPKAYTPHCGFKQVPMPILAGCTEPLVEGAADLRGLWQAVDGKTGHIERIEQCGNRVIVAGDTFIHDFIADGTLENGANDINPMGCFRIQAAIAWNEDKQLQFKPFGVRVMVSRHLQDENTLVWTYADGETSTLKRICHWPEG